MGSALTTADSYDDLPQLPLTCTMTALTTADFHL